MFGKVGAEINKGIQIEDSSDNDIIRLFHIVSNGDRRQITRVLTLTSLLANQPLKRLDLANHLETKNSCSESILVSPDSFYSIKEFIQSVLQSCRTSADFYQALRIIRYSQHYEVRFQKDDQDVSRKMGSFFYSCEMLQQEEFWSSSLTGLFNQELKPYLTNESTFEEEKFNLICVNMCNIIYSLRNREKFIKICSSLLKNKEHIRVIEEGVNKLNKLSKDQKDKPVFVESIFLRQIEQEKRARNGSSSQITGILNQSQTPSQTSSQHKRLQIFD